jgi:NAD(P)-dependent dehydrogenase (short-subunit alcohol dehydrogenase family)
MDLEGKVAVVTGGGGGIGSALAAALAQAGARVAVADLDAAAAERAAAAVVEANPGRAFGVGADVTKEADLRALLAQTEETYGAVDVFCANAGVMSPMGLDTPDAEWSRALDVNVLAHVRAARLLVPAWIERGGGYFVATASAAGLLTQVGSPAYSVTKHGAVAFAEWLSVTYGDRGVRVSCLCPMGVNTPMLTDGLESEGGIRGAAQVVAAAGPVLEPGDVADEVVAAIGDERFLILPHPEVLDFYRYKGSDYDRWLAGMRRLQAQFGVS